MQRTDAGDTQQEQGDEAVTPTYTKPETIALGSVTELTRNTNQGPFTDGASDDNYRWRA